MIFDVKYTFTDFYRFLDSDKNEEISINEFFNGTIELMEAIGISFKSEMKKNLTLIYNAYLATSWPLPVGTSVPQSKPPMAYWA